MWTDYTQGLGQSSLGVFMSNIKSLAVLFFLFLLGGCAASGPIFSPANEPQDNKALVYIYRIPAFIAGGQNAYFYIDEKKMLGLSSNGYSYFYLSPGKYELSQKWPSGVAPGKIIRIPIEIKAGETRYFRFVVGGGMGGGILQLEWAMEEVPAERGREEIKERRFQIKKEVPRWKPPSAAGQSEKKNSND